MSGGDFGGRLDRVGFWAGFSFVFSFLCRFSFLSCCLFRLLVGGRLLSELILHVTDNGWDLGDTETTVRMRRRMAEEEEDGGRGEPRASHQVAGEELWWENGSHHYKATHLSGHVTGLGLSRLCITPSTRLKNLRSTASDDHDPDRPHQSRSSHHLISFLLLSFVFLVSSQSTISLRLLPPYAP